MSKNSKRIVRKTPNSIRNVLESNNNKESKDIKISSLNDRKNVESSKRSKKVVKKSSSHNDKKEKPKRCKLGFLTFSVSYSTLEKIKLAGYFFILSSIIHCIYIITKIVDVTSNLTYFINLITENEGYFLPTILATFSAFALLLNLTSALLISRVFKSKSNKLVKCSMLTLIISQLLFVLLLMIICVVIVIKVYEKHEKLHDGIIEAMRSYNNDFELKKRIDLLQIKLQCCGSKSYTEWYDITWYEESLTDKTIALKGETPFSCCSLKSSYPCIHHGLEKLTDSPYNYQKNINFNIYSNGCFKQIIKQKRKFGWQTVILTAILFKIQISVLGMLRFLQTVYSRNDYIVEGKKYKMWIFKRNVIINEEKETTDRPPPVPPLPPELL